MTLWYSCHITATQTINFSLFFTTFFAKTPVISRNATQLMCIILNWYTEHRRNSGGTTEHYPEHQRNTATYQRNTNVTPVEHPQINGTIQNEFKLKTSSTIQNGFNHTKPVKLRPSPKTIRKSLIFLQFQRVQKSNNPLKLTHGWILFNAPRLNNHPCFLK